MIQLLAAVGGQVVEKSWGVAAVTLKYVLALQLVVSYHRAGVDVSAVKEVLLEQSRPVVLGILAVGTLLFLAGRDVGPLFARGLSEVIAVGYLAFLFWHY
ncbi:MAG: hypothetical protein ABEK01_05780 [Candidatus Nanohaloarchaea archaeon]